MKEDQQRFNALYYGQPVAVCTVKRGTFHNVEVHPGNSIDYLELKDLSSITDEDAREFGQLFLLGYSNSNELDKEYVKWYLMWPLSINEWKVEEIDYLRKQGYLIPFDGYSVEELLKMGWAKYREA